MKRRADYLPQLTQDYTYKREVSRLFTFATIIGPYAEKNYHEKADLCVFDDNDELDLNKLEEVYAINDEQQNQHKTIKFTRELLEGFEQDAYRVCRDYCLNRWKSVEGFHERDPSWVLVFKNKTYEGQEILRKIFYEEGRRKSIPFYDNIFKSSIESLPVLPEGEKWPDYIKMMFVCSKVLLAISKNLPTDERGEVKIIIKRLILVIIVASIYALVGSIHSRMHERGIKAGKMGVCKVRYSGRMPSYSVNEENTPTTQETGSVASVIVERMPQRMLQLYTAAAELLN